MPDSAEGDRPRLILASASPRRLELLARIGVVPDEVAPAQVDENPEPRERPADLARRLAAAKARDVAGRFPGALVLGADTVVACGRRILPKAASEDEARRFLGLLSGRRHRVYGGVSVIDTEGRAHDRLVVTAVAFKRLSAGDIATYIGSGEWRDKAGAYAIQGEGSWLVTRLEGSLSNVIGLPLEETLALLEQAGHEVSGSP